MKVTILGCGSSSGTPSVNAGWGECDKNNIKNQRLRPSIMVEEGADIVLVDTSPDLRRQLLDHGTRRLDAVLFTHAHADHLHGIDDLRPINRAMEAPLDIYADAATLDVIGTRFAYTLEPLADGATFYYKPTLTPHEVKDGDEFQIGAIPVVAFEQDHGTCATMGYRFGPIAYSTDLKDLSEAAFEALEGVGTWIIGTLFDAPHPTHAHVDLALEWIARVKPRQAVLTHLSGDLDYDTLAGRLPDGVQPAYDGMVIEA